MHEDHHHDHDHEHAHSHGGEGHAHPHEHPHTHDHTHGHEHAHVHEHTHPHEHEGERHEHPHTHDHSHPHAHDHAPKAGGGHSPSEFEKVLALMNYMLEHNRQHTEELAQMIQKLEGLGQHASASLLQDSVQYFSKGNDRLEESLKNIKGEA